MREANGDAPPRLHLVLAALFADNAVVGIGFAQMIDNFFF